MDASAGWESLAVSWGCSLAGTTLGGDRPLMIGNDFGETSEYILNALVSERLVQLYQRSRFDHIRVQYDSELASRLFSH